MGAMSAAAGANGRIRLGLIGAGGRGNHLVRRANANGGIEWVAVFDAGDARRDQKDVFVEKPIASLPVPAGCACGDGVIDWGRVIAILNSAGWSGVLSCVCSTSEQAARSHLQASIAEREAAHV